MEIQEITREQLMTEIEILQMKIEKLKETEVKYSEVEKLLRESEAKYRSLFKNMINAFALHRMLFDENNRPVDCVFLEVNEAFERFTGLKRENIIGKKATEVLPGIGKSEFNWIDVYGQVALTGEAITFEQYSELIGGWYHVSAYSPEIGYFVTIFIDITERKQAFEELRKAKEELEQNVVECNVELRKVEERFQAEIAEHMKAADLLQKESERSSILLHLYNKALQLSDKELYDYTLDQVVQLTDSIIGFFHIVSDDQKELILTTWNQGALNNCTALYKYHYPVELAGNWVDCVRLKRPVIYNDFPNSPNQKGLSEGHVPVLRFMSIPVLEEDKVRIIFGVGNKTEPYGDRDVVQLQLVANELHKIIKQRSLQGEKDNAEAANRAKSAFLANMSHELRTPLNAILGYSQLMQRDDSLQPVQREYLNTINRSGEHLLALINDVLEISKIEARRVTLDLVTFDLHTLIGDLEKMFRLRTSAKKIHFNLTGIDEIQRYIIADENKLRQILINMVGNAIKFTDEGGIILRFSEKKESPDEIHLVVEIEDTGLGIAEEELDKLFHYFEQTASGKQIQAGTGLGLAISREYTRMMGGDITVISQFGKGSTFRVEVAVQQGIESGMKESTRKHRVIGLEQSKDLIPRVLVVDDILESRNLLVQLLEMVGFDAKAAANGLEAVQIFEQWRPSFIWMDIRMPVMDGLEATRRIKATEAGKSTAIVAISASILGEEKEAILAAGCDGFVRKPYREEEIFEVMAQHLGLKYIYENEAAAEVPSESAVDVNCEQLVAALDTDLRQELYEAVLRLNIDQSMEVIDRIMVRDASIGVALKKAVETLDFESLLNLLEAEVKK